MGIYGKTDKEEVKPENAEKTRKKRWYKGIQDIDSRGDKKW